jgi:hypothetical protein
VTKAGASATPLELEFVACRVIKDSFRMLQEVVNLER